MKILAMLSLCLMSLVCYGQSEIHCAKFNHFTLGKSLTTARTLEDMRMHDYDVHFYHLDVSVSNASVAIDGNVRITATVVSETLNEFVVELDNALSVSQVESNGSNVEFTHSSNLLVITLERQYSFNEPLDIRITYGGIPPTGTDFFQGISSETDTDFNQRVTWTLSEPYNAREWWPVKQVLTDKADSAYIYITVPAGLKAGASGVLNDVVQLPNGSRQYQWHTKYPIAYYLISLAVSDYNEYKTQVTLPGQSKSTEVLNYIYKDPRTLQVYKDLIDGTNDQLLLFTDLFGMYPYADEKYGHAMAPMGGGMEHQTMSTMSRFTFRLIAHELAHQWYGDLITCGDWSDIWINEGFARYSEYLALEFLESRAAADAWMTLLHDNVKRAPDGSVYVPSWLTNDPYRIFNGRLTYNKGGAILHTLRYEIDNDPLFFNALKEYSSEFRDSTATGADFRDFISDQTGIDLNNFFDEWYYGQGYPTYDVLWRHRNDTLEIQIDQTPSAPSYTPFFTTSITFDAVDDNNQTTRFRVSPQRASQSFKVPMPSETMSLVMDPENTIIKEIGSIRNADVTSVNKDIDMNFQVYPNPASSGIKVVFPKPGNWTLRIIDLDGRILLDQNHDVIQQAYLSTENIPEGMYILEAQSDIGALRTRVVVLR